MGIIYLDNRNIKISSTIYIFYSTKQSSVWQLQLTAINYSCNNWQLLLNSLNCYCAANSLAVI